MSKAFKKEKPESRSVIKGGESRREEEVKGTVRK